MWWKKQEPFKLGVESLIYKFRNQKQLLLIFLSLGFAFAGATIAMQEEIIAMVPVLVVLAPEFKIRYQSYHWTHARLLITRFWLFSHQSF